MGRGRARNNGQSRVEARVREGALVRLVLVGEGEEREEVLHQLTGRPAIEFRIPRSSNGLRRHKMYERGRGNERNYGSNRNKEHGSANDMQESSPQHGPHEHMKGEPRHRMDKENRYDNNERTSHASNSGGSHSKQPNHVDEIK